MDQNQKINEIFLEIDRLKACVQRIESHIASESGTLGRETQRLREEINKVETTFNDLFYNKDDGFLVRIDRLLQESNRRQKTQNHIIALWIVVVPILLKMAWDFLNK